MRYFQSGTYVFSSGLLQFKVLKKTLKGLDGADEINLLDPEERKKASGYGTVEIQKEFQMVPVKWSGRTYVMYEDDLSNFANAINLGLEPRSDLVSEPYYGSFFLRAGDEQKKVIGPPGLPQKWQSVLLRKPVTARIVALEGKPDGTIAKINKGSRNGLRVGMRLVAKDQEPSLWSGAEIVSVDARTAKVRTGNVSVGDKLSTKYVRRDIYRRN